MPRWCEDVARQGSAAAIDSGADGPGAAMPAGTTLELGLAVSVSRPGAGDGRVVDLARVRAARQRGIR